MYLMKNYMYLSGCLNVQAKIPRVGNLVCLDSVGGYWLNNNLTGDQNGKWPCAVDSRHMGLPCVTTTLVRPNSFNRLCVDHLWR